ncbi:MAG: hypothetical protein LQ340_002301 [Diploschistes diacapsis]|nr:MAG: hypothetical protein LQ340_002301 [Diploschistes diacapsis]
MAERIDGNFSPPPWDPESESQQKSSKPLPFLVKFYRDLPQHEPEPDDRGRTLGDMLRMTDDQMEGSHDWVQYVFPLPERSAYNLSAPVVTKEVVDAFNEDSYEGQCLRCNLLNSLVVVLGFYGFKAVRDKNTPPIIPPVYQVRRSDNHESCFRRWVKPFDHNHLRITRIIRSCRLLGLDGQARAFYNALDDVSYSPAYQGRIGMKSRAFWRRAMDRPLWNPPEEDDDVVGEGCAFLLDSSE